MHWELEIKHDERLIKRISLKEGVFSLGRQEADIVIDDVKASRQHCNFYVHPDGISVIDAGSTNGTFVNGVRIDKKDLRDNDTVIIGTTKIRIIKC